MANKQFISDQDRFIGGSLRKANVPFVLEGKDIPKKLPKGMKAIKTVPAKQVKADKEAKAKEAAELKETKQQASVGNNRPNFMDNLDKANGTKPAEGAVTKV